MATSGTSRGSGPERAFLASIPAAGSATLPPDEGHHLVRVRRVRVGDEVVLFDGRGRSVLARLVEARAEAPTLEIVGSYPDREPRRRVHVASAVPGPSRIDDLVASLAELGVTTWTPLRCERSERGALEVLERRRDRLARLILEAGKVSGRSRFLVMAPPSALAEFVAAAESSSLVLLDPDPRARPLGALVAAKSPDAAFTLVVGPEGGFTPSELAVAAARGVPTASLGACALRTELAAVAAAAVALASG